MVAGGYGWILPLCWRNIFTTEPFFMNQPISFPANIPNKTTIAAMEAARRGEVEHVATLEELLKALDVVDKK